MNRFAWLLFAGLAWGCSPQAGSSVTASKTPLTPAQPPGFNWSSQTTTEAGTFEFEGIGKDAESVIGEPVNSYELGVEPFPGSTPIVGETIRASDSNSRHFGARFLTTKLPKDVIVHFHQGFSGKVSSQSKDSPEEQFAEVKGTIKDGSEVTIQARKRKFDAQTIITIQRTVKL